MLKSAITLQRSPLLAFILVIHPLLTILSLLGKVLLYSIPIGEDCGTISLMSVIERGSLDVLRGAALTGNLRRDVKVRFIAAGGADTSNTMQKLSITLHGSEKNSFKGIHRWEDNKVYG